MAKADARGRDEFGASSPTSRLVRLLLPRGLGAQCTLALVYGVLAAYVLGPQCSAFKPLAQAFLRASQIVTMPYIILELLYALSSLSALSLRSLARTGGASFLGLSALASVGVLTVPLLLPKMHSAPFFSPSVLVHESSKSLLETYLPYNIFSALADDNFPAVVIFTAVVAVVLQGAPGKHQLLPAIHELRLLFHRMNKLVAKATPVGVFALSSTALMGLDAQAFVKMQTLPILSIGGGIVLGVCVFGLMLALTPFTPNALWQLVRGPMVLTASSGNLIVVLPMVTTALEEAVAQLVPEDHADAREVITEQVGATVPVAFALPMLGQVYTLVLLPIFGWYADRPLTTKNIFQVLATGIPGTSGGFRSVIRQELLHMGLPEDLIGLTFVNADWLFRLEKTLSLLGLVAMTLVVTCHALGRVRIRWAPLAFTVVATGATAASFAFGATALFAKTMAHGATNDKVLMSMEPIVPAERKVTEVDVARLVAESSSEDPQRPGAPSVLEAIRQRGVLRVGLRAESAPWVYRNEKGALVGYDMDLMQDLAQALEVDLAVSEAPMETLETLVESGAFDVAVGGILDDPRRPAALRASTSYQTVHRSVLVWDDHIHAVQTTEYRSRHPDIVIGYSGENSPSLEVRRTVAAKVQQLKLDGKVQYARLGSLTEFFDPHTRRQFDAFLTTAEGGAALAILHPETTDIALFGQSLPEENVILLAARNRLLGDFVNHWLAHPSTRILVEKLFAHWIRGERK